MTKRLGKGKPLHWIATQRACHSDLLRLPVGWRSN